MLVLVAFPGALAHSHRGFTGSISHAVSALTNPNATRAANTAARLTAVASVRARYWKEALQVFEAHPALGAGAEGYWTAHLRYETRPSKSGTPTASSCRRSPTSGCGSGVALALLLTWMGAAGRPTHLFNRRWTSWRAWREIPRGGRPGWRALHERARTRYTPERVGMLCMLVPGRRVRHALACRLDLVRAGDACVALLCAGWLAGRGELSRSPRAAGATGRAARAEDGDAARRTGWRPGSGQRPSRTSLLLAAAVLVLALLAAWSQWQPSARKKPAGG